MNYHQLSMENHNLFTKKVFEHLSPRGLTAGQPKILEYLYWHDGSVQVEIAKACQIEPATVTNLLRRMETAKLIERKINEENRRYWNVYLTSKGRHEAQYVVEAFQSLEEKALAGFSKEERAQLVAWMQKIRTNLNEE